MMHALNILGAVITWLLGLSDAQTGGPPPGVPEPAAGNGRRDCRDCPLMQAAAQVTNKQRGRKLTS